MSRFRARTMKYITLAFALALVGCSDEKPKMKEVQRNSAEAKPLDPKNAKAAFTSTNPVDIARATESSSLKVPTINLVQFDTADFVQIMRCAESVKLKAPDGTDIDLIARGSETRKDQLRWAWQNALGRSNECRLVGTQIIRSKIQDLAAPSGKFYYVVNPCVTESRSTSGDKGCSYDLLVSPVVEYESEVTEEFVEAAAELASVEGRLSANFQEYYSIAKRIEYKLQACNQANAEKQAAAAFLAGLGKIVSLGLSVVGGVVAGPVGTTIGRAVGGVLNLAVFANAPEVSLCEDVTDLIKRGRYLESRIQANESEVIEKRSQMADLESTFDDLNDLIRRDYN